MCIHLKTLTISGLSLIIGMMLNGIAWAYTDDTGVIDGLNQDVESKSYIDQYHFNRWNDHNKNLYGSSDGEVVIYTNGYTNRIFEVFLLGRDYSTDKGIKVGDSEQNVIKAYGPVYPMSEYDEYDYSLEVNAGRVHTYPAKYYPNYAGYIEYEYFDSRNSAIYFIINKYTQKVVLIVYQGNRHGSSDGIWAAKNNGLLPYLR